MMKYNCHIRLRGRPGYQAARRISLGYELDPAENRGFALTIPAYLVAEKILLQSPRDRWDDGSIPSLTQYNPADRHHQYGLALGQ